MIDSDTLLGHLLHVQGGSAVPVLKQVQSVKAILQQGTAFRPGDDSLGSYEIQGRKDVCQR